MEWTSGNFMELTYVVMMQRKGSTITVTVVAPGVVISLLGLFYIFLPRGSGERVPYLSTVILTDVMFLVMLT